MKLFRIAKEQHAGDLSGMGARLYGGRWNHKGVAVVYASESRALAALEYLVHVPMSSIPRDLEMMELVIPKRIIPENIDPAGLPPKWRKYPPPQSLATLGSNWVHSNRSLLLRVPSAVVENEFNVLINPKYEDLKRIRTIGPVRFEFDSRLLKL
jgi:RES domain-containing protein